jgi:hypothetical protein
MSLIQNYLTQILALQAVGLDAVRNDATAFNDFNAVYSAIFGKAANNCASCPIEQQYEKLMHLTSEEAIEAVVNRKYLLRENEVIVIGADDYTNDNLTDDKAASLLKQFPGLTSRFERMPAPESVAAPSAARTDDDDDDKPTGLRVTMPNGNKRSRKIMPGDIATIDGEPAPDGVHELRGNRFATVAGVVAEVLA